MRTHKLLWALAALLLISAPLIARASDVEDAPEEEDEYEDIVRAHLIIRKSVGNDLVVQGRNVTVELNIFNSGAGTAKNVVVKDTIPSNATLLEGTLEASFKSIASGSSVKHSYVVVFNAGGAGFLMPAAHVSYHAEDDSVQEGHSSNQGIYVMTPVQKFTRSAVLVGTYVSLGMARSPADWRNMFIVVTLVGIVVGGNYAMTSMNTAKTTRRRQKALQELEKDE